MFFFSVGSNKIDLNLFSRCLVCSYTYLIPHCLENSNTWKETIRGYIKATNIAETLAAYLVFVHFPLSSTGPSSDFVRVSYPQLHSLEDNPILTSRGNQVVDLGIASDIRQANEKWKEVTRVPSGQFSHCLKIDTEENSISSSTCKKLGSHHLILTQVKSRTDKKFFLRIYKRRENTGQTTAPRLERHRQIQGAIV